MTNEEAIKRLKEIDIRDALQEDYDALYMAIETLKQEPITVETINQYCKEHNYVLCEKGTESKTGHWFNSKVYDNFYICSECGESGYNTFKYCPNCGADMREGET